MAGTRAEVVSLTIKMPDLEDACDKAGREHGNFAREIQTKSKALEDHIIANWDVALNSYCGVLRFVWGIVKAADERSAGHTNKLKHLRLFFEEGRKVEAVSLSAGPSQEGIRVAELEIALKAKELKLQMLPRVAAKNVCYVRKLVG